MSVEAIQNNTNKNQRVNYLASAAVGGTAAYAMKYIIPVASQERDSVYENSIKKLEEASKLEKRIVLDTFERNIQDENVLSAYRTLDKANKFNPIEISKYDSKIAGALFDIHAKANEVATDFVRNGTRALNVETKALRSTFTFVSIGAVAALSSALVHNIRLVKLEDKQNKEMNRLQQLELNA